MALRGCGNSALLPVLGVGLLASPQERISNKATKKEAPRTLHEASLFEELLEGHVLFVVLCHDLAHRHLKVLLRDVDAPLPKSVHASLRAHSLDLGTRRSRELLRNLGQVNAWQTNRSSNRPCQYKKYDLNG